jgi:hypothetical protein
LSVMHAVRASGKILPAAMSGGAEAASDGGRYDPERTNESKPLREEYGDLPPEDLEYLERDDGGDDEEAEKYRYSRTGSDIQMPPVSDDEDAEKLRHIQAEKERKQMRK